MHKSGFLTEGREVTFWNEHTQTVVVGTLTGREHQAANWLAPFEEKQAKLLIEIRWKDRNGLVLLSAVARANILTLESIL